MINIVIPIASNFFIDENEEYQFPLPLIELYGKTLIEYTIEGIEKVDDKIKFIFILKEQDCRKYKFDSSLKLLKPDCSIIKLNNTTKGAICSILMAIDEIDKEEELIILNYDQFIDLNLNVFLKNFRQLNADGGLITFNSIHPRWSYAKIDGEFVIQTAEKNPISNLAIAGFYYFKRASIFIDSAFDVIKFDQNYNGNFYTSSVYNQMILQNMRVYSFLIKKESYYSFYSPQKVNEFKDFLKNKHE